MSAHKPAKQRVALTGVSETALLTLNARAAEARRRDAIIDDPMAVALVESIDFDFAKFGPTGQGFALRARAFDMAAQHYLDQHPAATVVALAEGLQTSFWRLDVAIPGGQFRWLTVDLPPIVDFGHGCCRARRACRCVPSLRWTTAGWIPSIPPAGCSSPPKDY